MNVRKHLFAIVSGSILAITAGGIGFLLFRSRAEYVQVKDKLAQAESRYNSLTNSKPFPSDENVEIVEKNADAVKVFYEDLLASLCDNQPPREDVNTAQFAVRVQDTFKDLRLAATNQTVDLRPTPDEFYFGFEQYQGVLPQRENIPRLLGQLRTVESLCRLLFDNKVSSLLSIQRDVFESPSPDGSSMMRGGGMGMGFMDASLPADDGMGAMEPGSELYTIEHLDVVFHARDSHVWSVLDALSSSPQFAVVTSIELRNLSNDQNRPSPTRPSVIRPRMPRGGMSFDEGFGMEEDFFFDRSSRRPTRPGLMAPTGAGSEAGTLRLLPHEERVVAGKDELVEVVLGLDVYRFCPEPAEEESEDTELELEG